MAEEDSLKSACPPVTDAFALIEKSEEFRSWKQEHPQAYLAHAFITRASGAFGPWQIGFYDPAADRIIVAEVQGESVALQPPQEVYKEPGHTILPLKEADAMLPLEQALATIDARMREAYKGELTNKDIILLQVLPEWGTIWNVTALTTSFRVINFKVDAKSGAVLAESRESLTTLGKKDE